MNRAKICSEECDEYYDIFLYSICCFDKNNLKYFSWLKNMAGVIRFSLIIDIGASRVLTYNIDLYVFVSLEICMRNLRLNFY